MTKVEAIEKSIRELSPEELADLREWLLDYDAATWDEQIASHARSAKLDALVREAEADYDSGASTEV